MAKSYTVRAAMRWRPFMARIFFTFSSVMVEI
jgi:hypothetical protein